MCLPCTVYIFYLCLPEPKIISEYMELYGLTDNLIISFEDDFCLDLQCRGIAVILVKLLICSRETRLLVVIRLG